MQIIVARSRLRRASRMRVEGAHGYRLTQPGGRLADVELSPLVPAALWGAYRHRVLGRRSAA
jgi:hypothetical protein